VENIVRFWIDNGAQSELLIVDANRGLVNGDVIRTLSPDWP